MAGIQNPRAFLSRFLGRQPSTPTLQRRGTGSEPYTDVTASVHAQEVPRGKVHEEAACIVTTIQVRLILVRVSLVPFPWRIRL